MSGDVPPPCWGFSLINIDEHHGVMFGGIVGGHCTNDVYYIDLLVWVSVSDDHDDVRPVTVFQVTLWISLTQFWYMNVALQSV